MEDSEYVRIKITDIPEEFILEYGLAGMEDKNGWIYFEIRQGCYGLPQAGILANNLLRGQLKEEVLLRSPLHSWSLETQVVSDPILSHRG